ncbi:hypothetical protein EX011_21710 [Salmonella enterica]|nr:hypothetical protein [Salmonella enterica]EBL7042141.1 hypothetical protein [Salmonella enterica]
MATREPMTPAQIRDVLSRDGIARICIPAELPHATIGAAPSVKIVQAAMGMDWDQGTLFLYPETPVTTLTPDDLEEVKHLRREGQSWAMHKAYERWYAEYDALVDMAIQLRARLLQQGMTMEELIAFAGEVPRKKGRQTRGAK